MKRCPSCHARSRQTKNGLNGSGSQRLRCLRCGRRYTPEPKPRGYSTGLVNEAINLRYGDGMSYRQIGRTLGISHQTAFRWFKGVALEIERLEAMLDAL